MWENYKLKKMEINRFNHKHINLIIKKPYFSWENEENKNASHSEQKEIVIIVLMVEQKFLKLRNNHTLSLIDK